MLRKLEDKKFLSIYPQYGLKPKDARAFPGNIKAVMNGRQIIDVFKYLKEGEIQVFTTNKLDPSDYDIFVANMIRQIFRSKLDEFRGLRFLIVFDEIHRILPKFGGSGQGFIQIERGCREFRKWGIGILLISQVLSDFVGQIKSNINTNVQMKTRDEGDLERIKMNYGESYVQELVKSPVGTGMVQNSAYNGGVPYYIQFRPIFHSVKRLADEELDEYNKYNDIVEQLQYEFEQLEELGQDVFDLKLELKLATDKIKSGNFNMVKIYLDGLTPRVEKFWDKVGKKPKKLEIELVSEEELNADLAAAKASHDKAAAADKKAEADAAAAAPADEEQQEMAPEMVEANLQALKELKGQYLEAIEQKDFNRCNDLMMEISNTPLPKDKKEKKDKMVEDLKKQLEGAKNPPADKKEDEVKESGDDDKKEGSDGE
jgi:hypothetical protein